MLGTAPRKARIYDRLEGQERLEAPRKRFGEIDSSAEALRPGALVVLSFECNELLAVRRGVEGAAHWGLATLATEWSSRGQSGGG